MMEVKEVRKDKEWILHPEGKEPIRMVVDKRIHGEPTDRDVGRGRPKAYLGTRTVRVPPKGASQTSIGHEVGHIILEHEPIEGAVGTVRVDKKFIREELEAEYWAYSQGFPKRRYKIRDVKDLALDIGMTREQFDKMHRAVRKRFGYGRKRRTRRD